jgi:hypothetical protein
MDIGDHIINFLTALGDDPGVRLRALALACAATVVIAILRDGWSVRPEMNPAERARVAPPQRKSPRSISR